MASVRSTAIPPPRFDISMIIAVGIGLILGLGWWCSTIASNHFLLTGLSLDIAGAILLVIPHLPRLDALFETGHLREAYETLTNEETGRFLVDPSMYAHMEDGNTDELPEIFRSIQGIENISEYKGFREAKRVFSKWEHRRGKIIEVAQDVIAFIPTQWPSNMEFEGNYSDVWINPKDPHPSMKSEGPHASIQKLEFAPLVKEEIDEMEAKFRRCGISIIIFGFLYQGISVLV